MRDLVDGITEYDPALLQQHNLDPSSYTGSARFSQGFFDRARELGYPVTVMIQETVSERSQEPNGYIKGVMDCQFAESRARERGFTGPIDYVVSDGNSADSWDSSEYGRGISDTMTLGAFGYGAHGVLDSFTRGLLAGHGAHLVIMGNDGQPGRHVPETWGGTNLIGQVVGPSPIPDTDLNHVHADYTVEDDMTPDQVQKLNEVWAAVKGFPNTGQKSMENTLNNVEAMMTGTSVAYGQTPLPELVAEAVHEGGGGHEGGGTGLTEAQVRAIVRSELDATKLGQ